MSRLNFALWVDNLSLDSNEGKRRWIACCKYCRRKPCACTFKTEADRTVRVVPPYSIWWNGERTVRPAYDVRDKFKRGRCKTDPKHVKGAPMPNYKESAE